MPEMTWYSSSESGRSSDALMPRRASPVHTGLSLKTTIVPACASARRASSAKCLEVDVSSSRSSTSVKTTLT